MGEQAVTNISVQESKKGLFEGVTRQQWLVFIVAFLGWMFDSMDANLYVMVLFPSMTELMHTNNQAVIGQYGGIVMAVQLLGWALGGIIFGIIADYWGRTKTMIVTILMYAVFTGLSALSQEWWHLAIFRFMTGLGIGGEWSCGIALIAETWPDHARGRITSIVQSTFGLGFFAAAFIYMLLGSYGWRVVFLVGILPAFVTFIIRLWVEEPERWVKAKEIREQSKVKEPITLAQLFKPIYLRNTLVGLSLAIITLIVFYGATQWVPTWVASLARERGIANPAKYISYVAMMMTAGSVAGYLIQGVLADRFGRKRTFAFYFIGSLIVTPAFFFLLSSYEAIFWCAPVLGFFSIAAVGMLAIYLPELFPTKVRATGQGFCFNAGRILSALGPLMSGFLVASMGGFNKAAGAISLFAFFGLIALLFAPETKGKPLPE